MPSDPLCRPIVKLELLGYAADKSPIYVFTYNVQPVDLTLPIHDHRDNVTGLGYAFAVYAPGTALPQQPWHI